MQTACWFLKSTFFLMEGKEAKKRGKEWIHVRVLMEGWRGMPKAFVMRSFTVVGDRAHDFRFPVVFHGF